MATSHDLLSPDFSPRLLTIQAAAVYLSTTVWRIRELIRDGKLRAEKYGGKAFLLDRHHLDAFVDSYRMGSVVAQGPPKREKWRARSRVRAAAEAALPDYLRKATRNGGVAQKGAR